MRNRRAVLIAVLALLWMSPVQAQRLFYNGTIGVSSTNTAVPFTDNGSGGTGQTISARHVLIRSDAGSANTCYFDMKDTVATSADIPLEAGAGLELEFDPSTATPNQDGWTGMGAVCNTAETATFYVTASR